MAGADRPKWGGGRLPESRSTVVRPGSADETSPEKGEGTSATLQSLTDVLDYIWIYVNSYNITFGL